MDGAHGNNSDGPLRRRACRVLTRLNPQHEPELAAITFPVLQMRKQAQRASGTQGHTPAAGATPTAPCSA